MVAVIESICFPLCDPDPLYVAIESAGASAPGLERTEPAGALRNCARAHGAHDDALWHDALPRGAHAWRPACAAPSLCPSAAPGCRPRCPASAARQRCFPRCYAC